MPVQAVARTHIATTAARSPFPSGDKGGNFSLKGDPNADRANIFRAAMMAVGSTLWDQRCGINAVGNEEDSDSTQNTWRCRPLRTELPPTSFHQPQTFNPLSFPLEGRTERIFAKENFTATLFRPGNQQLTGGKPSAFPYADSSPDLGEPHCQGSSPGTFPWILSSHQVVGNQRYSFRVLHVARKSR
jgi:hypothetical protein